MAIVTNQTEFKDAVSNMEAEIIIANDISLTSVTNIGYSLNIKGGADVSIIWNGTGATNRTMLAVTSELTTESLTLNGDGRDVTFVAVSGGSFTMNDGVVLKNTRGMSAQSAVKVADGGTFIMNGGLITGIDTTDAVYSSNGTIAMHQYAAISDNVAAGITLSRSSLTMTGHSRIANNAGKQTGGAGLIIGSNVTMGVNAGDAPLVAGNRTSYTCGAWYLTNGSSLTMRYGAEISDNFAEGLAGGIGAQETTISMHDNAAIKNNKSNSDGGGLFMSTNCNAVLDGNAQVSGNTATGRGGGIYVQNGATLQIGGNVLVNDNIGTDGGGIYLNASTAAVGFDNSSPAINDNTAEHNGGGIYVSSTSSLDITGSSSITGNEAPNGNGGGIYTEDTAAYANLTTSNDTLFSGNTASTAYAPPVDAKTTYPDILFSSTSITDHPLNNFDINYTDGELLTFQIEYNANGGTGSHMDTDNPGGSQYSIRSSVETGISRPDYTFGGWNTDPDGSGTSYVPGDTITITSNVILYAQWVTERFTITYGANGGSGSFEDSGRQFGDNYVILSPRQTEISRPGFTFIGWNTLPDGSGTSFAPGNTLTITGDMRLYALWRQNPTPTPGKMCREPVIKCRINIAGQKIWNDNDNIDGKRPDNVAILLLRDGEVYKRTIANSASDWAFCFCCVPVMKNSSHKYDYQIDETDVPGYAKKFEGYNIINTLNP